MGHEDSVDPVRCSVGFWTVWVGSLRTSNTKHFEVSEKETSSPLPGSLLTDTVLTCVRSSTSDSEMIV